ncbi:hypothetical protein CBM2634_P180004 [Cupriavidus taiwanensis]|uniref:DUF4157 domain-containing protein n=2 Tax=Cupriavidus taiwanensis TaxID=164546 RepID=A0A375JDM6_9BURK|nr:hypothetical protein CBM2634_P180004 [Cupriavidus taiwanensis]
MWIPEDETLRNAVCSTGLFGPDTVGLTLGRAILIAEGHATQHLLTHEVWHVHQYEEAGSIERFLFSYLAEIATFGNFDAPLEIDARPRTALRRKIRSAPLSVASRRVQIAREEGYKATILLAISALDCLYAHCPDEPSSNGSQTVDATDLLLRKRILPMHSRRIRIFISTITTPTSTGYTGPTLFGTLQQSETGEVQQYNSVLSTPTQLSGLDWRLLADHHHERRHATRPHRAPRGAPPPVPCGRLSTARSPLWCAVRSRVELTQGAALASLAPSPGDDGLFAGALQLVENCVSNSSRCRRAPSSSARLG